MALDVSSDFATFEAAISGRPGIIWRYRGGHDSIQFTTTNLNIAVVVIRDRIGDTWAGLVGAVEIPADVAIGVVLAAVEAEAIAQLNAIKSGADSDIVDLTPA